MGFDTKISDDDAKFVEATLDEAKRQERIERLIRDRRKLYRGLIGIGIAVLSLMVVDVVSFVALPNSKTDANILSIAYGLAMFVLIFAGYLYTNLQSNFSRLELRVEPWLVAENGSY